MRLFRNLFMACATLTGLFFSVAAPAQNKIQLSSPDTRLIFTFNLERDGPVYSVSFKGKDIVEASKLSLSFLKGGMFAKDLKTGKPVYREGEEKYSLIVGKNKEVSDRYKEVTIPLEEQGGNGRRIDLVARVFNDGLAFRYVFPEQKNWTSYELTEENTTFNLAGNPKLLTAFEANYVSPHEALHEFLPFSKVKPDTLMDVPTLIEFPGGIFMAITEADLVDYAGMYLMKQQGVLVSKLSPLPGRHEIKVKATLPHRTPWRVMLVGDRIGTLIESNVITSLNEPNKIEDLSWIKPGKSTWPWWNGNILPDTNFMPGLNFEFNKYYIDFCAQNNIEYHSILDYGNIAWYQTDARGIGEVGPHTDVTRPVGTLDMQKVCDYGKKMGVGIRLWVHWQAIHGRLEEAFTQFEKWGVSGLMVDFLNRDDQEMVNFVYQVLEAAAKHHLHIQFHGAYKPTGLSRTFPNEFTREGAENYEYNKGMHPVTADNDISVPFTRGLAGPTDYHLGGFRAVPMSAFKYQFTRPLVLSSRCHMLSMYVVLESYLQLVCDYPEAYKGQAGFEFIKKIPTTWDETKVPAAEVNQWISVARRKGTDWYMGTINNLREREVKIPLDFLSAGEYIAEIYSDASDAEQHPNHLIRQMMRLKATDTLTVNLLSGGGQAIHFRKVN